MAIQITRHEAPDRRQKTPDATKYLIYSTYDRSFSTRSFLLFPRSLSLFYPIASPLTGIAFPFLTGQALKVLLYMGCGTLTFSLTC
jgi:hypothetical protein